MISSAHNTKFSYIVATRICLFYDSLGTFEAVSFAFQNGEYYFKA